MTENELAKNLLLNDFLVFSDGYRIKYFETKNAKYEQIRQLSQDTFEDVKKIRVTTTCEIDVGPYGTRGGILFFDYYKSDAYQSTIGKNYIVANLFKINRDDVLQAHVYKLQPILEQLPHPKVISYDSPYPTEKIVGFNCAIDIFGFENPLREMFQNTDNLYFYPRGDR